MAEYLSKFGDEELLGDWREDEDDVDVEVDEERMEVESITRNGGAVASLWRGPNTSGT